MENRILREQIEEDIQLLKDNLSWDTNVIKDEYTFNYWILSNIYNLDEEECNVNITEYNDKGIDCFVHYEDDKELYIIQNKYYSDKTILSSKEVSDFLTRPLSKLRDGNYRRSVELQKLFEKIKDDEQYKIFLHFYITNNNKTEDVISVIKNFKDENVFAEIFFLDDIKNKYYGKSYKENITLNTKLNVKNKAAYLAIRPQEYNLPNMSEAYYVMAKVTEIYKLWNDAEAKNYPLFEENIREYLGGTSGINKRIITTLKDENERGNFFYYNNGITIICERAKADAKIVNITNPQIVNGCQTVNSIVEALKNYKNINEEFEDVYIMAKILVMKESDTNFYRDIVKYTNSQNSINDKVFGATLQPFFTIQKNLKNFGFLLTVKQSDKYQFKQFYKEKKELGELLLKAKNNISDNFIEFKMLQNVQISLETLIQIIGALKKDAYFAYTKKAYLLKPTNKEYYQQFSTKIGEFFTTESIVKLIILYKKAEIDKRNSEDKKTPSPYYLLNFIGYDLAKKNIDKQTFFKELLSDELEVIYERYKILSQKYYKAFKDKYELEYNQMVKQKVDIDLMNKVLNNHFESMKEYNSEDYNELRNIYNKFKEERSLTHAISNCRNSSKFKACSPHPSSV
ncbi:MAG: AIPR family protein [Bacteroidales bacterium]|nr:AIPR family protein [Bacteroidales bacterium]